MRQVRPCAVAGLFYPAQPEQLRQELNQYLSQPHKSIGAPLKAIIVPHAGYIYSAAVAASAYALIAEQRASITKVVLLGPCHHVAVRGLALPEMDSFVSPFGEVAVDQELVAAISGMPQVVPCAETHLPEHSLEVQLPFLQQVLDEFTLLPLVVGQASPQEVAEVLEVVWGGDETLIVVSSDLSHYLPYAEATAIDRRTSDAIIELDNTLDSQQACGCYSVNGLLRAAKAHHLTADCVDLRNSGDTAGSKDRVVGYGAYVFH